MRFGQLVDEGAGVIQLHDEINSPAFYKELAYSIGVSPNRAQCQ